MTIITKRLNKLDDAGQWLALNLDKMERGKACRCLFNLSRAYSRLSFRYSRLGMPFASSVARNASELVRKTACEWGR